MIKYLKDNIKIISFNKITMFLKYAFSFVMVFILLLETHNYDYFWFQVIELSILIIVTNIFFLRKWIGYLINVILMLLFNIQVIVMTFANTYLTLMMLSSLDSIKALSGKALIYITAAVLVIVFSFLPVSPIKLLNKDFNILSVLLLLELALVMHFGNKYSPMYGYLKLASQQIKVKEKKEYVSNTEKAADNFYKGYVLEMRDKPEALSAHPNVILIFTEGLSRNIITDSRNIMPQIKKCEASSLSFDNYYNHTFATYRGIIGQLYSGYQLDDYDKNELVSIQSILHDNGYNTCFINTEPNNADFTTYLSNFEFDELISEPGMDYTGLTGTLSDKEAYESLYDNAMRLNEKESPFFVCMYTFGTHLSLNTTDEYYGDGSVPLFNKFYNLDCQFGNFLEKLNDSALSDNTIIVFTADHSTAADAEYCSLFTEYKRYSPDIDIMPLFIYYKGIVPENIDAEGRNSLDLAPTLLDYIDISQENYFLGTTLFIPKAQLSNEYILDTVFYNPYEIKRTQNGDICDLTDIEMSIFEQQLDTYLSAKVKK